MIAYLYDEDEELIPWAQDRISHVRFRPDAKAIGIEFDGRLRGVTVFDTFSVNDCLVSVASDGGWAWFTREFAVRTMAYPFHQCQLSRITCLISELNQPSLRFTRRFGGWVHEGTLRKAGPDGEHLLLFGMLREDCRWLKTPPAV